MSMSKVLKDVKNLIFEDTTAHGYGGLNTIGMSKIFFLFPFYLISVYVTYMYSIQR